MEHVAVSIVSWLAGAVLGHYGRDVALIITGWFNSDIPKLNGRWLARGISDEAEFREHVTVTQIGRLIFGEIASVDGNHVYKFRGRIVRHSVIATFYLVGHDRPTGTGSFQLVAAAADQELVGKSLWHDHKADQIVSADYHWIRSLDDEWVPRKLLSIKTLGWRGS
jgi:hypothetical protein